ncbi:MAG: hypothetical protein EOM50_02950 [Erysipelotrichia bacterium]|nr:hypothetical protein [Erysipelotrichia bacterium]NCC54110.1 hypothetical protein [Erysipelotrichia bacterium]
MEELKKPIEAKNNKKKTWIWKMIGIIILVAGVFGGGYYLNETWNASKDDAQAKAEKGAETSIFEVRYDDELGNELYRFTIIHKGEDVLKIKSEHIGYYDNQDEYISQEEIEDAMQNFRQSKEDSNTYIVSSYAKYVFDKKNLQDLYVVEVSKQNGLKSKENLWALPKQEKYYTDNPDDIDYNQVVLFADGSTYSEYKEELMKTENIKQVQ